MVRLAAVVLGLLVVWTGEAQRRPAPADRPAPRNPAARPGDTSGPGPAGKNIPAVVERLDTTCRFHADGTGDRLETSSVQVLTEAGVRGYGVLVFPFHPGLQRVEIAYARVSRPDGTVIKTSPEDAQDSPAPLTQVAPQYSDLHYLVLPVRGLAAGDRLEFQVRTVTTKARAAGQFWGAEDFSRGRVVQERTLELRFPEAKEVHVLSPQHPAQRSVEAGEAVYRWHLAPAGTALSGAGAGSERNQLEEERASPPPVMWTTFASWAEVGAWFRMQAADALQVTPAVKAKADRVIYGLATPQARAEALFAFTTREIRTIAVPLGQGGYQPHAAEEVLTSLLGDSQDKAALLTAMLRAEGLQAEFALAPEGVRLDPEMPAPFWFNTALVSWKSPEGRVTWLDPAPQAAQFGLLNAGLRGREVLVLPATGAASLEATPRDLPFAGSDQFTSEATLAADGTLQAHLSIALHGDGEQQYRELLAQTEPAQLDRVAAVWLQTHGLSGRVTGTVADDPLQLSEPLHLAFDLAKSSYGDWAQHRITPLEPGLELPYTRQTAAPSHDLDLGGSRSEQATSRLLLPPGYSLKLPGAVHLHTPFAELDKSYQLVPGAQGQTLVVQRSLRIVQGHLPVSDWPEYQKFVEAARQSEPALQLEILSSSQAPSAVPAAPASRHP